MMRFDFGENPVSCEKSVCVAPHYGEAGLAESREFFSPGHVVSGLMKDISDEVGVSCGLGLLGAIFLLRALKCFEKMAKQSWRVFSPI